MWREFPNNPKVYKGKLKVTRIVQNIPKVYKGRKQKENRQKKHIIIEKKIIRTSTK